MLRDDHAREAFLDELQKVARGRADEGVEDTAPDITGNSLGARAADVTRLFAEHAVTSAAVFATQLALAPATFANLSGSEGEVLSRTLRDLALVIVVTYGLFVILRLCTRRIDRSFGRRARRRRACSGAGNIPLCRASRHQPALSPEFR